MHGWIQAAYLEVAIGGLLGNTTLVVQIKRLANLNQILLLIFRFVCFLLGASGMEKTLDKYTTHEKEDPHPLVLLYPTRDGHMDCLGQASHLLYKMSRKQINKKTKL